MYLPQRLMLYAFRFMLSNVEERHMVDKCRTGSTLADKSIAKKPFLTLRYEGWPLSVPKSMRHYFLKTVFVFCVFVVLFVTKAYGQEAAALSERLAKAAVSLTKEEVVYDPSYFSLDYPGGDVPKGKGVCTDVVIRAFRQVGIDLQKEVHEDMLKSFDTYPKNWGLTKTDKNIDHRRVPNLMKYFQRRGAQLSITDAAADYLPGDVVAWQISGGLTHIGMVSGQTNFFGTRPLIVHNIGSGQVLEDMLFDFKIIGHYRL